MRLICSFLAFVFLVQAIYVDVNDEGSIRDAAATAAYGLQSLYTGNLTGGVVGKFPYPPFYWWLSGAAWGGMVDYQHYTGDESYFDVTYQALVAQVSPTFNFLPEAEKFDEGNDDVAFWAFAAMSAAEYGWPEPPSPYPDWVQIVDNVFNDMVSRWYAANSTCGGGLKWQIFPSSAGYDYKNSISNGGFLQIAARLWRHTGNSTYYQWAEKIWDWSTDLGFVAPDYAVFDGADEKLNCTSFDHTEWSYNIATYLHGCAVLANTTGGSSASNWTTRTLGFVEHASIFISPFDNATNVLFEQQCELDGDCNVDQFSFKAYLARWLGQTSILVPQTAERIHQILRASAIAAGSSCVGGDDGITCGAKWYLDGWDGTSGLGQSLAAMEVMYSLLVM